MLLTLKVAQKWLEHNHALTKVQSKSLIHSVEKEAEEEKRILSNLWYKSN